MDNDTTDVYDAEFVRGAFADMELALALERDSVPLPKRDNTVCPNCDDGRLVYFCSGGHPGSAVCDACGCVLDGLVLYGQMYGVRLTTRHSNYKRIHHFHERISQLLLLETQIPLIDMLDIAESFKTGGYTTLDKATVRAILRSVNKQNWIERWLQNRAPRLWIHTASAWATACTSTGCTICRDSRPL